MSAPKTRPPLLTWSPVVLLSALLLSPMTAGALWHALAQRFPQAFAALGGDYAATATPPTADNEAADSGGLTRRANDETPAPRIAARGTRRATAPDVRFPFQARTTTGTHFAARIALPASAWPAIADARARFRAISPACPRAPPV